MKMAETTAADWLSRLVQIPSVSPDQAGPRAGEPGEAVLGRAVAGWFAEFGGEVHAEEVLPGRHNVYGLWAGQSDRWAGVDVHLDTVGVEGMAGDPFSGRIADGRVHGRGAVDTKATLAVALALLERLHRSGRRPGPNLLIAATVDEETGARGAPALAAWLQSRRLMLDELVVAEPTLCGPVVGHKGVLRIEFHVEGTAAHAAQPELGRNAVSAAAHVVLALEEEHQRLATLPPTIAGQPTLTVTVMQGGSGTNVVPAACRVAVDRRLAPGEEGGQVAAQLTELAERVSPLPVRAEVTLCVQPFAQAPDIPWVRRLAELAGRQPAVVPFCTNAWAYPEVARACVVLGPGSIEQAHGADEWVAVSELERLSRIYADWWRVE